ncbi:hypothetical protein M9978_16375 [Sphingomonas sp. MG17]|uniref:Uncharacterized protein n=1 Tax=Sphingomonas tagetis TaxID=2949092 RepID=A0A9X2HKX1_9SPHN|nr:hypothetical protein [Sphingomonas tagetis]MCP3732002.1 hypothetical protein [Sphingomonas tagetis]
MLAPVVRVFNTSGTVLLDHTYKNLALRSKAVVATDTVSDGGSFRTLTISDCDQPMVAIACTSHFATVTKEVVSGSDLTITIACNGPVGTSVTLYYFDVPLPNPTPSGIVFRMRTDAGELTFDADYEYMDVVDFLLDGESADGGEYAEDRDYAVVVCRPGITVHDMPLTGTGSGGQPDVAVVIGTYGFRSIAGGVEMQEFLTSGYIYYAPNVPIISPFNAPGDAMILDVTHF